MNFNEWCLFVGFGSKCDRTKFENFLNLYENAKFIRNSKKV